MAYFEGGPNPPKDWGARSDLRKLKREHAKLARVVDNPHTAADAVLPVVQARIAVEREQVAAQIAQAIEAERDNERVSDPEWGGLDLAAHIARQHAKGDGDG